MKKEVYTKDYLLKRNNAASEEAYFLCFLLLEILFYSKKQRWEDGGTGKTRRSACVFCQV